MSNISIRFAMQVLLLLCIFMACSTLRKNAKKEAHREINSVMGPDTIYVTEGVVVYEHADSLYVVSLDNGQVVSKHVVEKGYTWKQLYAVAFAALIVGVFIHFFLDKF